MGGACSTSKAKVVASDNVPPPAEKDPTDHDAHGTANGTANGTSNGIANGTANATANATTEKLGTAPGENDKSTAASADDRNPASTHTVAPTPYQPLVDVQQDSSLSCVQRVQQALDAIQKADSILNACCEVLGEQALKQAEEQDARVAEGVPRRLLEGVPLLVIMRAENFKPRDRI